MKRVTLLLPLELHEQLRQDASRAKISLAELIRSRLQGSKEKPAKRRASRDPILKVAGVCRGPILSDDIDESLYGG